MMMQDELINPSSVNEIKTALDFDHFLKSKIQNLFENYFFEQHESVLDICNQHLILKFSCLRMAKKYMPAIQHLQIVHKVPLKESFTLYILDIALITKQKLREFLLDFFKINNFTTLNDTALGHFLAFDDFAYYFNDQTHWGIWFVNHHEQFSLWHFANPFRYFFYDWLVHNQYQLLHASAISDGTSALLFAGASGSGKSTTALMAMKYGYSLIGDDHCAVSLGEQPRAYSLYNAVKLDVKLLTEEFNFLQPFVKDAIHTQRINKSIINLAEVDSDFISSDTPIKALVCLSINTFNTVPLLQHLPKNKALNHILLTTIEQCAWSGRKQMMSNIHTLVHQLPCYHLTLCPTHERNLVILRGLFNG